MKVAKRQLIIDKALELIRKNGYRATGMRELAKAFSMEAPSLYNHIKSKEEILQETCFGMANKFIIALDEVNDIYFNGEEKLRMAIRNHIEILTSNLNATHVFLYEWQNLSEPHLSKFVELRHRYQEGYREIISTGEKEGVFKESDIKFATLTILSAINWVIEWYRPDGKMNPKEIADKLTDFILSGLKKEKI
ncbi:MAG: TetR family transcriptional regulator [Bacteroidetes bacterium]|nr:TetR family transcriptional regulator [Bacteroidota bacterium]